MPPSQSYPRFTPIIEALPSTVPFVGPEAQERQRGRAFRARIGANESVFGPSPRVIAALEAAAPDIWKYCDPDNHDLQTAVAAFYDVSPDNVVIIEGIDGGLGLTNRLVTEPGSVVVTSDGAYPTFNFHVSACGGRLIKVPFRDDKEDVSRVWDVARAHDARLVYVSNPNNPMGTWWRGAELEAMIAELPAGCLLALDEAYVETAPADTAPRIDVSNPQVLRLRTFSKAYGMAGARIGYCLGEASVIRNFEKVRNHYGISRLSQIGALAALGDQAYLAEIVERIASARARITAISERHGLVALPSATNFVTVDCGHDGVFARRVLDGLLARDVFVRMPAVAPLNRCIRIGVGAARDLDLFEAALPEALLEARET
ncbi:MAG: pyridoxal phosphate-dependent aminotransferase [Pseudomonadota bacterium]